MAEHLSNEKELLAEIGRSNERAFEQIVRFYFPHLLPFSVSITKNRAVAEDIVQEAFIRLWQRRHDYEQFYNLRAWLFTVTSNLSLTYIKKMALEGNLLRHLEQPEASRATEAEERLHFKESGLLLQEAMLRLPPQQREVYRLSRYEELSIPEIAEKLHLSPNTVKNHLVKALQSVRGFISQRGTFFIFF
ncbi:RNA polymerase sigma-70 factor [Chitinophaga horti]|uniref:RNA polymerase sigma-70 factor n=1 Tax=Chitinophaga horti TaxID=2920382 RepID=A0ABY6J460_9BACT|nr:RNA polymerase sigma-70 factor [Chitinophaga horti]UYQ94459.1 RNA polymerase sigma-70 factor [Chitinophaga horti]